MKITWIFLVLFFFLSCPDRVSFSKDNTPANNQSLRVGIGYLNFQKRFLDFPITWKSTMSVFSANYQINHERFCFRIGFDYGRSTFIDVNGSTKQGRNYFSILAFNYDFVWYKLGHRENPTFLWGLGLSLENLEIVQKIEISPGKYNKYVDQFMGIGPGLNLLWRLNKSQYGVSFGPIFSIPYASFGIKNSNVAFTGKSYLWWLQMRAGVYYKRRILKSCDLSIGVNRDVLVYGRSHRTPSRAEDFYSGGAVIFRYLEMGLDYNF